MIPIKDNIPTDRFGRVTVALICANLVGYVLACLHGGSLISGPDAHELMKYGVTPNRLLLAHGHAWTTVFTAMFVHASLLHLAGNLLFLWIFANTVEDAMGPVRFLAFYVVGGIAALALQTVIAPHSTAATVGAAGAIAAVIGGYVVLHPHGRVLTVVLIPFFFTVLEVPALVMAAAWFVLQAVYAAAGLTDPTGSGPSGVAYLASIGGFAFGLAAIRGLAVRRRPTPPTAAAYR